MTHCLSFEIKLSEDKGKFYCGKRIALEFQLAGDEIPV
jgi:hypothetical protein